MPKHLYNFKSLTYLNKKTVLYLFFDHEEIIAEMSDYPRLESLIRVRIYIQSCRWQQRADPTSNYQGVDHWQKKKDPSVSVAVQSFQHSYLTVLVTA